MGKNVKIKRGLDIALEGQPENKVYDVTAPVTFAIKPRDFKGLIPKLLVKQGDEVKAGDCLLTKAIVVFVLLHPLVVKLPI
jgi:Na+-transporting NADH:ubiquinone oxidoreductase subunit A